MLGLEWQAKDGNADLMIILSEQTEDRLFDSVKTINDICEKHDCYDCLIAEKKSEQDELLLIRSEHYNFIVNDICDSFDYAVPVSCIPDFIADLKALAASYNTGNNIVAHIADGNVHGDMWYVDGKTPEYADEYKKKMYDLEVHVFNQNKDTENNFVYVIETKTSSMEAPVIQLVSEPIDAELAESLRQAVENRNNPTPTPAENDEMTVGEGDVEQLPDDTEPAPENTPETTENSEG